MPLWLNKMEAHNELTTWDGHGSGKAPSGHGHWAPIILVIKSGLKILKFNPTDKT